MGAVVVGAERASSPVSSMFLSLARSLGWSDKHLAVLPVCRSLLIEFLMLNEDMAGKFAAVFPF